MLIYHFEREKKILFLPIAFYTFKWRDLLFGQNSSPCQRENYLPRLPQDQALKCRYKLIGKACSLPPRSYCLFFLSLHWKKMKS